MRWAVVVLAAAVLGGCQNDPDRAARMSNAFAMMAATQPTYQPAPPAPAPFWANQPQPVYVAPAPGQQLNTYLAQHRRY